MTAIFEALGSGLALALSFHPILGLLGGAAVAAVLSMGRGARRSFAAGSILLGFWLVGDGLRVIARARDLVDGVGVLPPGWLGWSALAVWAAGGIALGYALPAWAGTYAGRRVTLGTGWLTGIVISVSLSLGVSALVGGVG